MAHTEVLTKCRKCGAEGPASADRCSTCGRRYRRWTQVKIWALVIVLMIAVAIGFSVLLGIEMDKIDQEFESEFEQAAITRADYLAVQLGLSESRIRSNLDVDPDYEEEELVESIAGGKRRKMRCLYYNKSGHYPDVYRFCFEDDRLFKKEG